MTREEAIVYAKRVIDLGLNDETQAFCEVAIKALEEPSGDLISRQAVFEQINCWIGSGEYRYTNATHYLTERVKHIPSAKQERTGHWRAVYQGDEIINYRCSECDFGNTFGKSTYRMNFCPNCGSAMKEE